MCTLPCSVAVALHLLEHASLSVPIDINVATPQGHTVLGAVRSCIADAPRFAELRSDLAAQARMLSHLKEVEQLLLARGAIDGGWS